MKRKSTLIFLVLLVLGLIGFASCDDAEDLLNPFDKEDYLDKDKNLLCLDPAIKWTTNKVGKYESDNAKEFDEATAEDLEKGGKPGSELFKEVWDGAADLLDNVGVDIPTLTICSDAVSKDKKDPSSAPSGAAETAAAEAVDDPIIISGVDGEDAGQECVDQIAAQQDKGADSQTVIILIDTTGSMSSSISGVKDDVADIITEVTKGGGKVLIAEYRDASGEEGNYHCEGNSANAYTWMDSFSDSAADLNDYVDGLSASGGCDLPESLYGGIYTVVDAFKDNADFTGSDNRMLIAITDADPIDTDTTYDGRKDTAWLGGSSSNEKRVGAADAEKIMADNFVQFVLINVTW